MKNIHITSALFLSLAMSACGDKSTPKETPESTGSPKTETTGNPENSGENTAKSEFLIENKKLHAFSNPEKKDVFFIGIKGKNLLDGKVIFTITSSDGKQLLNEEFDADYLLGYDFTGDIKSQKDTDAFIKKRIESFFSAKNFSVPAIEDDVAFEDQEYYIDKETWEEIKANKQAIGFYYLLGKEDGRHIAFSVKKQKIVMFYNCC